MKLHKWGAAGSRGSFGRCLRVSGAPKDPMRSLRRIPPKAPLKAPLQVASRKPRNASAAAAALPRLPSALKESASCVFYRIKLQSSLHSLSVHRPGRRERAISRATAGHDDGRYSACAAGGVVPYVAARSPKKQQSWQRRARLGAAERWPAALLAWTPPQAKGVKRFHAETHGDRC